MTSIYKLVLMILGPENDWGHYVRKIISLMIVAWPVNYSLGAIRRLHHATSPA